MTVIDEHDTVSETASRTALLRRHLISSELCFLMEAHNGISARIVEEAGFPGIWASGLAISTALGLRDSNEACWSQVLDVIEYMADTTRLPILVDGDTGHGNFNNVRRFVRKLGERGAAGVCIEDKVFPKCNSFLDGGQHLADIEEFCGRLKAAKDSQTDGDFSVVARVEALIAGQGMQAALRRAEAYHAAGADAVLIHSKRRDAAEILEFSAAWAGRCPLVIVPTMYYTTPASVYAEAGISTVIWANHSMRAAIAAMRETCRRILAERGVSGLEERIAGVDDIFRLLDYAELEDAESRYLPRVAR